MNFAVEHLELQAELRVFQRLLDELRIQANVVEIRAMLMCAIWLSDPSACQTVRAQVWTADVDLRAHPEESRFFSERLSVLYETLCHEQVLGRPFRFVRLTPIQSSSDLSARVACRVGEISALKQIVSEGARLADGEQRALLRLTTLVQELVARHQRLIEPLVAEGLAHEFETIVDWSALQTQLFKLDAELEEAFHLIGRLFFSVRDVARSG